MHFVMSAFSNHAVVLHNVTPIDFDIRTVFNEHNIRFRTKLRHLTYWLNRRLYSAPTRIGSLCHSNRPMPSNHGYRKRNG